MRRKAILLFVVTAASVWLACGWHETEAQGASPVQQVAVDLRQASAADIKLLGGQLILIQPDGQHVATRVALSRTTYEGTAHGGEGAGTAGPAAVLHCYELRSVEENRPFTWSIWSPSVLSGQFQVLSDDKGQGFLVLVDTGLVRFVSIDGPKNRFDSFVAYLTARASSAMAPVLVTRLLGREAFLTGSSNLESAFAVHVLGISQEPEGDWVLTVAGVDKAKTYRLRFGALTGEWRAD